MKKEKTFKKEENEKRTQEKDPADDPGGIRTPSLLIWSQTRCRCATKPVHAAGDVFTV